MKNVNLQGSFVRHLPYMNTTFCYTLGLDPRQWRVEYPETENICRVFTPKQTYEKCLLQTEGCEIPFTIHFVLENDSADSRQQNEKRRLSGEAKNET